MNVTDACPNCGAPFSECVSVGMGDTYGDVFGLTPQSLLSQYLRVCLDPSAAQAVSSAGADADVYLHTAEDLGRGTGFSD